MNRNNFDHNMRMQQIAQEEAERKWRLLMEEQQMQQLMEAASQQQAAQSSAASIGGTTRPLWEVVTNTAYIYPPINVEEAIALTQISFTIEDNRYIFATLPDLDGFYYDVWYRTSISQPAGNLGYSMGVGTKLAGSNQELHLDLADGTRIITW